MADSEAQWIAQAKQGDQQAFRCLVQTHARKLHLLCLRITRDEALAEDAVQEAFYNAWRKLDGFDERAAFSTWLHRIAVNAALEQLRRNARHQHEQTESRYEDDAESDFLAELADEVPGPEARASGEQVARQIGEQMAMLSVSERAAFVLRHCEGRGLDEIAQTLSMNTGQCKQAIFRAVRKLRGALETVR
ncbi:MULTISPECIES: sigma-70 family RNA polymerase sigma factor [unclassified Lysobacter]|uniref:RNA polymerase sigma factor n=1 Tax=unclassified Lysobacter TaxID=2635362 RepID=UPI001BE7C7CB|nr:MULTISPECIES: sigma-70 family RNA polymerase sigma factor [unclassified Lysobacter]MBT2745390.1 sigma-70 family RNA polymerase sigma factor [Lysobacter sp. ISL-42]MBT2776932.1 sigma-70 family RNA polymerase sigma factor [Lysobacter sp. ISL-54]MBT2781452.1 sigma-70 family RNA polymerase sigma factor [Lysobacter sp. ISL-52]